MSYNPFERYYGPESLSQLAAGVTPDEIHSSFMLEPPADLTIQTAHTYTVLSDQDVADMSAGDSGEYRRIVAVRNSEWYSHRAQELIEQEDRARQEREMAFARAITPRPSVMNDTSHPYHPENPFNVWRNARQRYIDGDDNAKEEMLAAVRTEDADKYDEEARA